MDRYRIIVKGTVQGVGFRPFVYNLASSLNIKGFVANTSSGVEIEAEGKNARMFLEKIKTHAPPLSDITSVDIRILPPIHYSTFEIKKSEPGKEILAFIPSDTALCKDCRKELYDKNNRHYHYPFTNCTNCGPRYSITKTIPYDRKNTTMAVFKMCPECEAEYNNPRDRRFHAQPNACPKCGPQLESGVGSSGFGVINPPLPPFDKGGKQERFAPFDKVGMGGFLKQKNPIEATIELLNRGAIVAIKGIGGFHIACDAGNEEAVKRLRERKRRGNKPFAIMCPDLKTIGFFATLDKESEKLLSSHESPALLLRKKANSLIADSVSPNNPHYAVMLPYTPLHDLLFFYPDGKKQNFKALVMTSGNISEEPIIRDNNEALEKLKNICDAFLFHNRDIQTRVDDSVFNMIDKKPSPIRRARGYVPQPIKLYFDVPPLLACGAELKSTFTIAKEKSAIISQHLGDMESYETLNFFEETLSNLKTVFKIEPEYIFYDMHPDYIITKWAKEMGMQGFAIQHHEAHIASCMADNGIHEDVIGIALDGTGYGRDGNIWGGEIFVGNLNEFKRVAHFKYIPMPGSEMAIREPWRMAVSVLMASGDNLGYIMQRWGAREADKIAELIKKNINSPLSSSCGRLFDAAASLIAGFDTASFEAEAAIGLEALAVQKVQGSYSYDISLENVNNPPNPPLEKGGWGGFEKLLLDKMFVIDFKQTFQEIVQDIETRKDKISIASKFHNTIAHGILDTVLKIASLPNIKNVCLSGGVFQNRVFTEMLMEKLKDNGFTVFTHRILPPNDGGLSLGQAVLGGWQVKDKK